MTCSSRELEAESFSSAPTFSDVPENISGPSSPHGQMCAVESCRKAFIFPGTIPSVHTAPSVSCELRPTSSILTPRGAPGGRRAGPPGHHLCGMNHEAPGNQGACPRPWGSQPLGLERGCLARVLTQGLFHGAATPRQLTAGLFRFQTSRSSPSARVANNKVPVCARKRA